MSLRFFDRSNALDASTSGKVCLDFARVCLRGPIGLSFPFVSKTLPGYPWRFFIEYALRLQGVVYFLNFPEGMPPDSPRGFSTCGCGFAAPRTSLCQDFKGLESLCY